MSNLFKKVTSTVSVVAIVASAMSSTLVANAGSTFTPYADALATAGIISKQSTEAGYNLGNNVTRAEMAKVAVNIKGATTAECTGTVFSDVTSTLGDLCGYVEAAANAGLVNKTAAKFRPMDLVTRAEALKMLLSAKGIAPSTEDQGFMDLGTDASLNGYINAAAKAGIINKGTSFNPNNTATRGEAFKIASNSAGLTTTASVDSTSGDLDLGDLFGDTTTTTTTTTGTTTTTTTTTTTVAAGDLEVALNPASLAAGTSVPKIGTITAAKFDLTAGGSDISVNTLTLKRDGLGSNSDIQSSGMWFEIAGQRISTKASVSSDSLVVLSFSPTLVVKAGSTTTADLIVSLSGASSAQHRFAVTSAASVTSSAAAVKGTYPLYTNTFVTTSYNAASVTVARNTTPATTVKVGDTSTVLGDFSLTLGSENRDVNVVAFTLYNSGTSDLSKSVSNLALYNKATGAKVSTDVKISGRYVTFTVNDSIPYTVGNRSYQVKADIISADRANDTINLSFDSKSEYVVVNEKETGFRAAITINFSGSAVGNLGATSINLGDFSIVKDSTVSSTTVSKNTLGVTLLAGIIKVQQPTTIENITVTFSGGASLFNSGVTRVKLVVGDISSTQDAADSITFSNTYTITKDTPVYVYADIKSTATAGTYSATSLTYGAARYVSNDQAVVNPTNAFASAGSNTINATVANPTITVSNNGAAASAQTVIGAKDVTLGKFAFANNNLSPVTVSNLTFTATGSATGSFFTNTTVDLYIDGVIKESRKLTGSALPYEVAFSSTSYNLGKGATSNVELRVSSVQNSYGTGTFQATFSTGSFSDDVGQAVSVNGAPSGTNFTFNSKGSVTFSALSSDNQAKILVAGANQEIGKFTVSAQNDSVNLLDFYATLSGVTDASAYLSNVTLVAGGNAIANGSVVGGTLKFTSINNSNGYQIVRGADPVTVTVKANVLALSTADSGTGLTLALGTTLAASGVIDDSTNVADRTAKIRSVATSQYLESADATTPTTAVASHFVANSKIAVAASNGTSNDEHKFSITTDAAGRVAISTLSGSMNTGTGLTGTLYLGSISTGNEVATWSGNTQAFTITGASASNSQIILSAGSTTNFILKLTGVSSSTNANSIRTLTINGVSYKDYVDGSYAATAVTAANYTNVGLPVSSSTTY